MKSNIAKSGIYQIKNLINGNIYIGSSKNIYSREAKHKSSLRGGYHANNYLQNSWNKYKEDNFIFEIIEYCDENLLLDREQYYINLYNPEFNITKEVIRNIPSEESKLKHSITKKELFKQGILSIDHPIKEIYQYDLNGNFLKKWNGCQEASDYYNLSASTVYRAASGLYRTGGPFMWFYKYMGDKINKYNGREKSVNTLPLYNFIDCINNTNVILTMDEICSILKTKRATLRYNVKNHSKYKRRYLIEKTNLKIKIDLVKSDKLLENPEEDNQQPS